jgi:glycosyltransferase involved in cell wall biosynthesis
VVEAMMSGTPVIAYSRGSMPELIVNKKTGFLVKDVAEAVSAVNDLKDLNAQDCHDHAVRFFSRERMIDEYFEAYQKVLKEK